MRRLVVVVDPAVLVSPAQLAAAWDGDDVTRAAGAAVVEPARPGDFFGVVELVVVPLAVNLTTSAITALVGRLVARLRPEPGPDLEITETTRPDGDRVVVVRTRGDLR